MTESEVVQLPSSVLRESVQSFTGSVYRSLFQYRYVVLIILISLALFFVIRTILYSLLKRRARKNIPESTNTWFKWEDFRTWQKEGEKGA